MQIQWQSKRFVRRRVMKQKALPSETLTNVLTRSKITANLIGFTKFRFGTCLSFMKCFDHFWTNDFSTKEGFKNFKLDLICMYEICKHVSLSRFPTKWVLWILWPQQKKVCRNSKKPIKNLYRISISIDLTQKELIAWA